MVGYLSRSHQHSPALDQQLLVLIRKGPPCRSQGKCHHPCPPEELALLGGGVIQKEREMNLVSFCPQSNGARIIKDSCLCNLLIPRSFSFGENCQLLAPLSRLYSFMWAVCVGTDFFNCGLHIYVPTKAATWSLRHGAYNIIMICITCYFSQERVPVNRYVHSLVVSLIPITFTLYWKFVLVGIIVFIPKYTIYIKLSICPTRPPPWGNGTETILKD